MRDVCQRPPASSDKTCLRLSQARHSIRPETCNTGQAGLRRRCLSTCVRLGSPSRVSAAVGAGGAGVSVPKALRTVGRIRVGPCLGAPSRDRAHRHGSGLLPRFRGSALEAARRRGRSQPWQSIRPVGALVTIPLGRNQKRRRFAAGRVAASADGLLHMHDPDLPRLAAGARQRVLLPSDHPAELEDR
jgi:hypothetical protein